MPRLHARHLPNLITGLRLLLVPPILWLLGRQQHGAALTLFVIAGVSDALDGALARGFHWQSRLGGILDPIADKALLAGCFLVLGINGELPSWLVVLVIGRDLVIVAGATAWHWLIDELHAAPSLLSKLNTAAQLAVVFAVLLAHGATPLPDWLLRLLEWTAAFTTLWSGADYVLRWGRRARRLARGEQVRDGR